jgi:hypothetical protein
MRICTDKNGKLIEMQSAATEGTLINNAINAGYKKEDIIEREVTFKEWSAIWESQPKPVIEKQKLDVLTDALIKKGTLTQADIDGSKLPKTEVTVQKKRK